MQAAYFTPVASLEGGGGAGWAALSALLAAARYWLQGAVPPWTSLDSVAGAESGMMTLIP